MFEVFLFIVLGYLFGSIPSSYIIGRIKGIDVRKKIPDGKRGASFTFKKVGKVCGVLVALIDIAKGFLAVLIANKFLDSNLIIVLVGLAAILGHNWSIFMNFKGGRGAATTGGVLLYVLTQEFFLSFLVIVFPILLIIKGKQYFTIFKKEFKTSDFFSAAFLGLIFVFADFFNRPFSLSFSPILFSGPMVLKALTTFKKNNPKVK